MSDTAYRSDAAGVAGTAPGGAGGQSQGGGDNVVDLLRTLVGQGTHLADQQLQLIKAEVREAGSDIKTAGATFVGAAVVGISGLGVTLMGLAYLLAKVIDDLALATLIVGVATLVIGFIMYRSAVGGLKTASLSPERTERTLQRTPNALRGDL
jgi:uncharacterized membrane protein YqjE